MNFKKEIFEEKDSSHSEPWSVKKFMLEKQQYTNKVRLEIHKALCNSKEV